MLTAGRTMRIPCPDSPSVPGGVTKHPTKFPLESSINPLGAERGQMVLVGIKDTIVSERQTVLSVAEHVHRIEEQSIGALCCQRLERTHGFAEAHLDIRARHSARGSGTPVQPCAENAIWRNLVELWCGSYDQHARTCI